MKLEKRLYQDRVVTKTIGFFESGDRSVLIESPTGSGKTIMGLRIVKHFEDHFGWKTNWVAMRRNLLRQVAASNLRFFDCRGLTPVSMFEPDPPPAEITVIDEAQHDATSSCVHIHAGSRSKVILGLSATPFRTDRLKLSFQRVVKDAGIHRLIQDGYLSPYRHWVIERWTPAQVAGTYLNEPHRWGKSVVFFRTIAECVEFSRHLGERGVHCEVVTGSTNREVQLNSFDEGDYPVIANVAVLAEGFDCLDLQTVFVRDSGKLPTIQMAGRAFRRFPGKTRCNVVQSQYSRWPFTRTAKPQRSFVHRDGRWLALGENNSIVNAATEMVRRIATIDITLPDYIKKNADTKRRHRSYLESA